MNILVATIIAMTSFGVTPSAGVTNHSIVMIQETVNGEQNANLRRASKYVDKYTKTKFKYGKCVSSKRCVIIKTDKSLPAGTGYSSWQGSKRNKVLVRVNPSKTRGNDYNARLWAHEIGHAMFLPHSSGNNLMYPKLHKGGKLVPFKFTAGQQKTLRRH